MTKLYYSGKQDNYDSISRGLLLFLPDLKRELSTYTKKDISELQQPFFQHIASSYQHALNSHSVNGLGIWRNVIKIYYELIDLCLQLNKHQEMYELYGIMTLFLSEGQQELFYCNEQLESAKDSDINILLKLHCDKYHTIYESSYRYSLTLASYCLDHISGHTDINKDFEQMCKDDVSYKITKIGECKSYSFKNDLKILYEGVKPIIRHSIAHKTFEYLENNKIKLINRKEVCELGLYELQQEIEKIYINFLGQLTAVTLFAFDNISKIDFSKIKRYSSDKQLRIIMDQEFRRLSFKPRTIEFHNNSIICNVDAPVGWDSPTELMGDLGGGSFYKKFEPVNLKYTVLRIIYYFADLKTRFHNCLVNVYEFTSDEMIGYVEVNLAEWTKLYDSMPSVEELDKYIISSTLR